MGPMSSGSPGRPECRRIRDHLVHCGVIGHHAAAEVGLNSSRSHRVHGNPAGTKLLGQLLGQHFDGSFARAIRGALRDDDPREPGRDHHDAAAIVDEREQFPGRKNTPLKLTL